MKNLIKILMGRKLSEKTMETLRNEGEISKKDEREGYSYRLNIEYGNSSTDFKIIGSERKGQGDRTTLYGNFIVITEDREYNEKGLLVERNIKRIKLPGDNCLHKIIIYNPPGRFIGTKIREAQ